MDNRDANPNATLTDDALMARVANGEQTALVLLIRRHQAQVMRVAFRLTGDANGAEDIAQNVFLRIWQKADRYTGRGQFTAYLLRITRNLCEDMRRRTPAIGLSEQERESACTLSAHAQAERNALQTAIEKAVHALPPFQRDVFILSHFENFTYAEIADILDCPPGTVASRKHQAVQNLRRALRDWFPGETEQTKEPTL